MLILLFGCLKSQLRYFFLSVCLSLSLFCSGVCLSCRFFFCILGALFKRGIEFDALIIFFSFSHLFFFLSHLLLQLCEIIDACSCRYSVSCGSFFVALFKIILPKFNAFCAAICHCIWLCLSFQPWNDQNSTRCIYFSFVCDYVRFGFSTVCCFNKNKLN